LRGCQKTGREVKRRGQFDFKEETLYPSHGHIATNLTRSNGSLRANRAGARRRAAFSGLVWRGPACVTRFGSRTYNAPARSTRGRATESTDAPGGAAESRWRRFGFGSVGRRRAPPTPRARSTSARRVAALLEHVVVD
jgi:hypothetical protein